MAGGVCSSSTFGRNLHALASIAALLIQSDTAPRRLNVQTDTPQNHG
jgi:hypothetical protein